MIQKSSLHEAIQITGDRMMIKKDHYVVVLPNNDEGFVPICCDICGNLYRNIDDELSHYEFGCCDLCSQQFARPRAQDWKIGWRPSQDTINEVLNKRKIFKE